MGKKLHQIDPVRAESRIRKIEQGIPKAQMAREEGIKRQAIDDWIRREDYQRIWELSNRLYKNENRKQRTYQAIARGIQNVVQQKYEEALADPLTWPQAKAVESHFALKQRSKMSHDFHKLEKLFTHYLYFKEHRIKASYARIGEGIMRPESARKVMNRAGVEPLTYRHKPKD